MRPSSFYSLASSNQVGRLRGCICEKSSISLDIFLKLILLVIVAILPKNAGDADLRAPIVASHTCNTPPVPKVVPGLFPQPRRRMDYFFHFRIQQSNSRSSVPRPPFWGGITITIQQVRRCGRRGGGHHAGSRGTLAKALCLGKKTPEARARDGIVLSIRPACCCVYVHWGKMARRVTKRHRSHSFCGPVCGPPTTPVVVVVSPLSVFNLCAAHTQYHTQYPPTRTGLSRRSLSIVPASVAGSW
jgi:hypothetical protein